MNKLSLTRRQEDVLGVVDGNGPVTVSDVTYHLPISEASARGVLSRLEWRGLVSATYPLHRSNVRAYVVTAKGSDALVAPELFTVLVTGKGIRLRARVPGWVAAVVFTYAKQNEACAVAASPAEEARDAT